LATRTAGTGTAERELEVIFESAVLGITLVRDRVFQRCNRRLEELFGYAPGEMIGQSTRIWYLSDAIYNGVGAAAYATLLLDNYHSREQEFQRKDGSTFWGKISGRALDPADPQNGSVWLVEDITERRRMLAQLMLAQRVFDNSSEAILITDAENNIISANPAFETLSGYLAEELIGRNPRLFKSGRHDQAFYETLWRELLSTGHWRGEIWDRSKDGHIYPKLAAIDVVRDPVSGRVVNHLAAYSDISEQKAAEDRLRHEAGHDPLTGLANRGFLLRHIEHALMRSRRHDSEIALFFLDLDGFKSINDTHGHAIGDRILVLLTERLRRSMRDADVVARLGGDEFVVVVEGRNSRETLGKKAEHLIRTLSEPCSVGMLSLSIGCSIGIACADANGTADGLLALADAAMYVAKADGRGRIAFAQDGDRT
jgi:diguanylate cyclase (GGDEF)-like protein/PAS domain S-box-containing protein